MFIKRNTSQRGRKTYRSVLLVEGRREPVPRKPGRPTPGARRKTRVVHHTLANLSGLPDDLIALIERHVRNEPPAPAPFGASGDVHLGPCYGVLAALHALACALGVAGAVGQESRLGRLALFLVYARLAHRGSRLSAVRWAEDHAVAEVLGLGPFDEDDLYAALDWLEANQERIEKALAPKIAPGAVFLYDVTSSYFEGQHNELAAAGYNRDGKRFKKQVVVGLLTDAQGEPLSIQVYPGNTTDTVTFADPVEKLKVRFGARDVVLVGDRGMIKRAGKQLLGQTGFLYVTALTDPQIRSLLNKGVLQMELFEEQPVEIEHASRRYVLRRNGQTRERERQRRRDQLGKVAGLVAQLNAKLKTHARCTVDAARRTVERKLETYRLQQWVRVRVVDGQRRLALLEDATARAQAELLDGCYVLESDVPAVQADTATVHARYMSLMDVERDFRTMKTTLLELRPIFLRKATRTRAHALVSLLALKIARQLDRRISPIGLTVGDALDRLGGVRLVHLGADPKLGLWRLPASYPPVQTDVLRVLPKLPSPVLSLHPAVKRRLTNARNGRSFK